MGADGFPARTLAVAEAGRKAFLLPATCAGGVGRSKLAAKIRVTRAREEGGLLSWDMLIADTTTVTRPLWRSEAGIFISFT